MHTHKESIKIWFFIGLTLLVYGLLISAIGIYHFYNPPQYRVVLWELHADIWWGIFLAIVGLIYVIIYRPTKEQVKQLKEVFK